MHTPKNHTQSYTITHHTQNRQSNRPTRQCTYSGQKICRALLTRTDVKLRTYVALRIRWRIIIITWWCEVILFQYSSVGRGQHYYKRNGISAYTHTWASPRTSVRSGYGFLYGFKAKTFRPAWLCVVMNLHRRGKCPWMRYRLDENERHPICIRVRITVVLVAGADCTGCRVGRNDARLDAGKCSTTIWCDAVAVYTLTYQWWPDGTFASFLFCFFFF